MKAVILVALIATVAFVVATPDVYYDVDQAEPMFETYMKDFNKHYKSSKEKAMRFKIFKANLVILNQLNADDDYATYGINRLSDMTEEELKNTRGFLG